MAGHVSPQAWVTSWRCHHFAQ